jgi:hypothetical protein
LNELTKAGVEIVEKHGKVADSVWDVLTAEKPELGAYLKKLQPHEWLDIDKEIAALKEVAIARYQQAKSQSREHHSGGHRKIRESLELIVDAASKGDDVGYVCWRDLEILAEAAPDMRTEIEPFLEASQKATALASSSPNEERKARAKAWAPFLIRNEIGYPRDRLDRELWAIAREKARRSARQAEPLGCMLFNTTSKRPAIIAWLRTWSGAPAAPPTPEPTLEELIITDAAHLLDGGEGGGEEGAAGAPPPALAP